MTTTTQLRALVVEDDPDIGQLLVHYLKKAGFEPTLLTQGRDVIPQVRRSVPDVIILDVMLPGQDGLEICRALRADGDTGHVPIIMLTARGEEADRIVGLELGADDYITAVQPGRGDRARAGAAAPGAARRRARQPDQLWPAVDGHRPARRQDQRPGGAPDRQGVPAAPVLMEHRGRVLSRDLLLTDVWGIAHRVAPARWTSRPSPAGELPVLADAIVTVKQFGYKLIDPPPA